MSFLLDMGSPPKYFAALLRPADSGDESRDANISSIEPSDDLEESFPISARFPMKSIRSTTPLDLGSLIISLLKYYLYFHHPINDNHKLSF
jgi:hypothetical protein